MDPVVLPPLFDLSAATIAAEQLRGTDGSMVIDGAGVERIGVAGLQLLLSAHATATATGRSFALVEPSEPLVAAARTAGAAFLLTAR